MAKVKFIKGNTATINGTAIADGQLLWNTVTGEIWEDVGTSRISCGKIVDTSLNPISPNAVSNQAITGSIVNSLATVLSTTEDYVPCGTKPVKEIVPTKKTITWANGNTPTTSLCYKIGNLVHIAFKMPFPTGIANATELVGTVPSDCIPLGGIAFIASGHANRIGAGATYADNFGILGRVNEIGEIYIASEFGIEMFGACVSIEYFID